MSQMNLVKIYFNAVRHGNTDGNVKQLMNGSTDDPLNATGLKQAIAVGKKLRDEKFVKVWASDLKRAYATATSIVERNQYFKNAENIETDVLLREKHFGDYEQLPFNKYKEAYNKAGFFHPFPNFRPPNGENNDDVLARVEKFMKKTLPEMAKLEDGSQVLVVTHGGVLRAIAKYLDANKVIGIGNFVVIPNTAVSKFMLSIDKETCQISTGECCFLYSGDHLEGQDN